MASANALRPLLAGLTGGLGGVLISQLLSQKEAVRSVADVAFEEPPPNLLATGRAGQILKFGPPKEGVSGPLVYKNHVLAYDSARRVPKWVAEHLSKEVAAREQVVSGKKIISKCVLTSPLRWLTGKVSTLDLIPQCQRNFLVTTGFGGGKAFRRNCFAGTTGEVGGLEGTWHQRGTTSIVRTA